jgi:esterase/lipase
MVFRTYKAYYKDIYFEFVVHKGKRDSILILPGFPSYHNLKERMKFFYDKGYNVFFPRYKGSYQSKGYFLEENPLISLKKFVNSLMEGKAISLYDMKEFNFEVKELIVLGICFSGPFSLALSSLDSRINKLILFSPAWDFGFNQKINGSQSLNDTLSFVKRAYKNLYRIKFKDLKKKLNSFKELHYRFYGKNNSFYLLVFIDERDPRNYSSKFKKDFLDKNNLKIIKHRKGHGLKLEIVENYWKEIENFLENDSLLD